MSVALQKIRAGFTLPQRVHYALAGVLSLFTFAGRNFPAVWVVLALSGATVLRVAGDKLSVPVRRVVLTAWPWVCFLLAQLLPNALLGLSF